MIYIYFNQPHLHHIHHVQQLQWTSSLPHTSSTVTSHNFTKFINNMTHINFIYNTSTLTSHLHRLHPSLAQSTPEVWHRNCDTGVVILDLLQSYTGIVTQEWLHGREFCFHPGIVNFLGDLLVPELLHSSYFPSSSKFYSFGDSQAASGGGLRNVTRCGDRACRMESTLRRSCASDTQTSGEMGSLSVPAEPSRRSCTNVWRNATLIAAGAILCGDGTCWTRKRVVTCKFSVVPRGAAFSHEMKI